MVCYFLYVTFNQSTKLNIGHFTKKNYIKLLCYHSAPSFKTIRNKASFFYNQKQGILFLPISLKTSFFPPIAYCHISILSVNIVSVIFPPINIYSVIFPPINNVSVIFPLISIYSVIFPPISIVSVIFPPISIYSAIIPPTSIYSVIFPPISIVSVKLTQININSAVIFFI